MRLFSQSRLFRQASRPWPWLPAHGGKLGLCSLPMGNALALATCHCLGGLAHVCCLEFVCAALSWLLPYRGCHGLGSMHVGLP